MELIPILSLIILVATISTFILAVGAYVLYKVRERKGRTQKAAQPSALPAELITPAPLMTEQKLTQTGTRRTYVDEQYVTRETGAESQRQPMFATTQERETGPQLRPTFVNPPTYAEEQQFKKPVARPKPTVEAEKFTGKSRFMRYTEEGYVEPEKQKSKKKEESKKEETLRWR
ncbi:MAG: hypothetical protein K9J16_11685 [Melioribacteraceae bacterium]|nr:hypothetical protein [Melioribacteraceae bacterium]MCF8354562.1 hypothetical protein [Melioribacteraceae bacterium]MCF8394494.1 hypothetical protein [Melioribacteraceae bacterium]MCF8420096.1 hypothetical protein [Melioribacteraceae bacterium]